MSKRVTMCCDACGKEVATEKLKLPLLLDGKYMRRTKVDICTDCAKRFMLLYYQIAEENFSTGIRLLSYSKDAIAETKGVTEE